MGNLHAPHSSDSRAHSDVDRSLSPRRKAVFETLWGRSVGDSLEISVSQLVNSLAIHPDVSRAIFSYLSQGITMLSKHALEDRLFHISAADSDEDLDNPGLTVETILAIATVSGNPVPSEFEDLTSLRYCFPSICSEFRRGLLHTVIPTGPNEGWQKLRLISPSIDPAKASLVFSSDRDGCSVRTLLSCILHYSGTLVFLFSKQLDPQNVFGFMSTRSDWTETVSYDESAQDTCMFELEPRLAVRRANQRGSSNFVYCNVSNKNRPVGIGLGGRENAFRLWLEGANILSVSVMQSDATFQPGHFISDVVDDFETVAISNVQIWGFGGSEAVEKQALKKAVVAEVRKERKRVDRSRMVENEFDRNVLLSKTFQSSDNSTRLGSAYSFFCSDEVFLYRNQSNEEKL